MAEAQGRMYEDGQAALTILTHQLRIAGNNPYQTNRLDISEKNPIYTKPVFNTLVYSGDVLPVFDPSSTPVFALSDFSVRGCDGAFSNITAAASLDGLNCATNTAESDSIALSYEADEFNTVPTVARTPPPTDCLGYPLKRIMATIPGIPSGQGSGIFTSVPETVFYFVADNRFYIDTTSVPSLFCQGNGIGSTAQPLVENIEDMQITYGVEIPSNQTRTVAGYLRADELLVDSGLVHSDSTATSFTVQERWRKVVTVRICLLVRSENAVVSDPASARYVDCAGTLVTAPSDDLRLRRTFSSTVILRNWLEIAVPTSS
jgi:type IV pilus assembly protein PilW